MKSALLIWVWLFGLCGQTPNLPDPLGFSSMLHIPWVFFPYGFCGFPEEDYSVDKLIFHLQKVQPPITFLHFVFFPLIIPLELVHFSLEFSPFTLIILIYCNALKIELSR